MATRALFFDAEIVDDEPDRVYQATEWTRIFAAHQTDGVVGDGLEVGPTDPASISSQVDLGALWIAGRFFEVYSDPETVTHPDAHPTEPRIDLVVAQLDTSEREIRLEVVEGTPDGDPQPPADPADAVVLAEVEIGAGATTTGSYTDRRPGSRARSSDADAEQDHELVPRRQMEEYVDAVPQEILQVKWATPKTAAQVETNVAQGAWEVIAGLSVSITPTEETSTIVVLASISATDDNGNGARVRLRRNGSAVDAATGDAAGNRTRATSGQGRGEARSPDSIMVLYPDAHGTTDAVTYDFEIGHSRDSANTIYVNRSSVDTDNSGFARTISTLMVVEVAADA